MATPSSAASPPIYKAGPKVCSCTFSVLTFPVSKFGHGFASAGFSAALKFYINDIGGNQSANSAIANRDLVMLKTYKAARVFAAAAIGGTASVISGGKFANGAITGAFAQMHNDEKTSRHLINKTLQLIAQAKKIAKQATAKNGSTAWAYDKKKGTLPAGTNKCTLFVHDVLTGAGIKLELQDHGYSTYIPFVGTADSPYTAAQWTAGDVPMFTSESIAAPGDIASYAFDYGDATGHAGIVGYNHAGQLGVFNANSKIVQWSDFATFFDGKPQNFMRYRGK